MRPTIRTRGFTRRPRPRSPARSGAGYAAPRAPRRTAPPRRRATREAPSSRTTRSIAEAIAATSRGGTSRPFSPSRTISGIPPTAVAITGVPAASASSSVCGRFSQAEVRSATSTARKSAITSRRVPAPRKRTRSDTPSSAARRSSVARSGPSPRTSSSTPGTRARASSVSSSAFCAVSRPGGAEREALDAERGARLAPASGATGTARAPGSGRRLTRAASRPQPSAIARRYALGTRTRRARRSAAVRVARSDPDAEPAALRLELLERAGEPAGAPLPLVRLVGDQLHHERPPRERRAERGTTHHRRRVDAVGAAGRARRTSRTTAR